MPNADAIRVLLAGRAGVYRLLQNTLGNEPSIELLDQLTSESAHQVYRLFSEQNAEFKKAVEALSALANERRAGGEAALKAIGSGFTSLFVGPSMVEAPPWESYHRKPDRLLFQETTLKVRRAYAEQGFLPTAYPRVADDHVAIELDFLMRLAERAEASWDIGDRAAVLSALAASLVFLQEHLMKWALDFAASVATAEHPDFYQEAVAVLVAFLPVDLDALVELQVAL